MLTHQGIFDLVGSIGPHLAGCYIGLYVNQWPDDHPETVLSDLTEAAWVGYARVLLGTCLAPVLEGNSGYMFVATNPVFHNTSGATDQFIGYFVVDSTGTKLLGYGSLSTDFLLIPDTGRYQLTLALVGVLL